jgi:DNA invertase Pin-like site-specific DNA recombinase
MTCSATSIGRTSADLAAARAQGRIGGRRKKLDDTKRREIAEAVISGRKTAAQMARMFGVSPPTVSRIVAAHVAGTGESVWTSVCRRQNWSDRSPAEDER